jgi:hypothetical protein
MLQELQELGLRVQQVQQVLIRPSPVLPPLMALIQQAIHWPLRQ